MIDPVSFSESRVQKDTAAGRNNGIVSTVASFGDRNLGAQYNGLSEKVLTLQVANAMKAELEKYDNVPFSA